MYAGKLLEVIVNHSLHTAARHVTDSRLPSYTRPLHHPRRPDRHVASVDPPLLSPITHSSSTTAAVHLCRRSWLLNRFRTEQGHCGACRRKWRLTDTDLCPCSEIQTMSHIVESCLLTKLNGGLSRLHSADEDVVSWLANYGSWHAYQKKKCAIGEPWTSTPSLLTFWTRELVTAPQADVDATVSCSTLRTLFNKYAPIEINRVRTRPSSVRWYDYECRDSKHTTRN